MRLLTRGSPLNLRNLLFRMAPSVNQCGVFNREEDGAACYMHLTQRIGEDFVQFTYMVAPPEASEGALCRVLEALIRSAGGWGAHTLTCHLPVDSPFLPFFRRADFKVWAQQRIYKLVGNPDARTSPRHAWRIWNGTDIRAMSSLYRSVVPTLLQSVEPMTLKRMLGLVLYDEKRLVAYADLDYGPKGVFVLPFFHPDHGDAQMITDLLQSLPATLGRPVYLCARSYQPKVAYLVDQLPFEALPEDALLARYMAVRAHAPGMESRPVFEKATGEQGQPISPIMPR